MTARLRGAVGACPTKACGLPDASSTACPKFSESIPITVAIGATSGTATWTAVKDTRVTNVFATAKASPVAPANAAYLAINQDGNTITRPTDTEVLTGTTYGGPAVQFSARAGRSVDWTVSLDAVEAGVVTYVATLAGDTASGCCD